MKDFELGSVGPLKESYTPMFEANVMDGNPAMFLMLMFIHDNNNCN